jgi:hypothetical protein
MTAAGMPLSLQSLRFVLVAHSCALLAQSALAGEFLSGTDGVVKFHEWNGWLILMLCILQIGLTALAMRLGSASWWLLIGGVFVLLAEALQIGTGYGRFLRVHIPLGVITFGAVLLQTTSLFGRRRSHAGDTEPRRI